MQIERKYLHRYLSKHDQDTAERVEKMRQDFVANVSHELRTPLTVILGFLETMIDQNPPELTKWRDILMLIYGQGQRMETIVNDLLLLSRLETSPLEEENYISIDVPSMLKDIYRDAVALSGEKAHDIQLDVEPGLKLHGFDNEVHSAFSNLIFNAVNYTPEKGTITIRWYRDGENTCLSVKDTGLGISEDDVPRITERFYRVDKGRSRERGGTGLGLAIVKHVLMRHHGLLHLQSELGKGSEFTCVFEPTGSLQQGS